jgi:zinc transporter, ZIP family
VRALEALAWGAAVSAPLVVGAFAGSVLPMWERFATTVTTFGGGILVGALAFDLVPEAEKHAGAGLTAAGLVAGCLLFVGLDWALAKEDARNELRRAIHAGSSGGKVRHGGESEAGRGKSIALGVFLDGVPETAALGITIAEGAIALPLLVGVIVSNLVESYGASEPIVAAGYSRRYPILLFAGIGVALLAAIVLGATVLAGASGKVIGTSEAVAGGAIFATVLVAIIPHAFAEVSRWAAVAAVAGLVTGYVLS